MKFVSTVTELSLSPVMMKERCGGETFRENVIYGNAAVGMNCDRRKQADEHLDMRGSQ